MAVKRITAPVTEEALADLRAGDSVLISGKILVGRDQVHKRLYELLQEGKELPVDLKDQIIYYCGPSPAKPGEVIGSAGPTTAGRMDKYTPALLAQGLKGMIAKGYRSQEVKDAIKQYGAVFLASVGGAGALLSKRIKASRIVTYEDLGPEALREFEVEDFPVIVIHDRYGGDLYAEGQKQYRRA